MPPKPKRIAVLDRELCRPVTCEYLCQRVCPINKAKKDCIIVSEADKKPFIDELLCIGCNICVRKCPRQAIEIVNLPGELRGQETHRYGRNSFALYRLPVPKLNAVVGLIGPNGIGKTTILNILSGNLKPNLGELKKSAGWEEIIGRFRGSEIQGYFEMVASKGVKIAYKPQHVDLIPQKFRGNAWEFLKRADEKEEMEKYLKIFGIENIKGKNIEELSGGELQLLAVIATMLKKADFYFFDEPSSYLDVFQRMNMAREIRKLAETSIVMAVEHDLAIADYLADYTHILYGQPGVFGVVSPIYGVRNGINAYLDGYIREENVRFRAEPIVFSKRARRFEKTKTFLEFPGMKKILGTFSLKTEGGELHKGEVIGIVGPNGIGKTTFIRMLAGEIKPENLETYNIGLKLSYKPQRLILEKEQENMLVSEFLGKIPDENRRIVRILGLEKLMERKMSQLSGGELQAVFIAKSLLAEHNLLLLDEPSAFLDVEQRLRVAKLIREHAEGKEIPAFVVDHDLQFLDSIADRLMVFEGKPGENGVGKRPSGMEEGMNMFLKSVGITFRRDPQTGRARANKPGSRLDAEQKETGKYFYTE